jgi:uncharacterized membrane protein YhhN
MKQKIAVLLALLAAGLYFFGQYSGNYYLKLIVKPVPVLVMLFLLKPDSKYRKYIFYGLLFSVIGDILLEWSPDFFVYGLVAFLTGHIAYILAFFNRSKKMPGIPLILLITYGVGIFWILSPHLQEMKIPVLIYIIVILTMAWRAFAQSKFNRYAIFAVIGALLFVFSDSLIAINKFHTAIPFARYFIMTLYWGAQSLIFYSAYKS